MRKKFINCLYSFTEKYLPLNLHTYCYYLLLLSHNIASYLSFKTFLELRKFSRSANISTLLKEKKLVQILQPNFYSLDSTKYLSGGAERYLTDLSAIIISLGYIPIIVQRGDNFWHKKHGDIHVIGINSGKNNILFNKLAHHKALGKPFLRIYSPFTLAYPYCDKNSIGISHGIFWDTPHGPALLKIITKSFIQVKIFISVDTATINWFRSSLQLEVIKKNMRYIPNYVDLQQFVPASVTESNVIKILYPRAISPGRGYYLLAKVIPNLLKLFSNIEFHIVGIATNSTLQQSLDDLVNANKTKVFAYHISANQIQKAYIEADIILIPTVASEGTSLSCLEAMATGRAIIATNVGGLSDLIIDGYNGLLISPSAIELQEAIIKLLNFPSLRLKLSENAVKVAQSFDKKIWEIKWTEILRAQLIHNT